MPNIQDYLQEAAQLFTLMDKAYDTLAQRLGFICRGCDDNCCRSLFYHHTLVEFFWLHRGLTTLSDDQRDQIHSQALRVAAQETRGRANEHSSRPMCPLNLDGRCRLYAHRPMICRLHGLPHELRAPDGRVQISPGCGAFHKEMDPREPDTLRLDRTPLYTALAQLEQRLRGGMGCRAKIKMTIAQMILQEPHEFEISH